MSTVYVLRLLNDKWYISKSWTEEDRLQGFITGIEWTMLHPVIRLEETVHGDANLITKEYIKIYGLDNVRGGTYSVIDLTEEQTYFLETEEWIKIEDYYS